MVSCAGKSTALLGAYSSSISYNCYMYVSPRRTSSEGGGKGERWTARISARSEPTISAALSIFI